MDAVGDILAEREHGDLPWGMGASLAVLLHTGLGAILVISALHRPAHFVQPRAVAVRLVQAGTLKGGPPVEALPEPVAEKPKIVKPPPAEEEPPAPSPKALLLPAKEKEKKKPPALASQSRSATHETPQAPAAPAAASARPGTGGPAGSGGNVGVGGATFDQPDFNYSYYVERMLVTIGMNWFKPAESVPISPMIRFRIERDGTISDPQLERSSGLPFVDRAALRSVMASSPLPPLPQEFTGKHLGVHLIFE
jgi:periplasmic protein TonB